MESDWRAMALGDAITLKRGYDLPSQARKVGPIPIVSSSGVSGWHNEAKVQCPGVVTGRYGTIGQVHFVDAPFWPLNTTLYVKDFKGNHPRYIGYLLRTIDYQQYSDKAAVPGINRNDLHQESILLPPLSEQERIADTLSALEYRIDLLRQTNTTLEAIAQALFKSWFVDFDPVHSKAEGLEPEAMDAATAALFTSEFEESELGLIPKGWRTTSVGDVVSTVKGRSYKSSELEASDVALVTLKSFNRGGGFRRDGFKPYTGKYKDEQVVHEGECIVAFTDVTQQAELIGRTAIVTGSRENHRLVASLDVGILRPKIASLTPAFLRALLSGDRYVGHIKGFTTGTTVLHLAKAGLPSYLFVMPPDELIASWQKIGGACIGRQALNVSKIDVLTELRDTLLPRLISGKLRLPEAEALLEEAAT